MATKPTNPSGSKQHEHPPPNNEKEQASHAGVGPAPEPPPKRGFWRDEEGEHEFEKWIEEFELTGLPDVEPDQIIEGILYLSGKLGVTAGSKSMKTWFLLYLCFCIANGLKLFGRFQCKKSKVAYFDFELLRYTIRKRLERIQEAVGEGNCDNIRIIPCRGHARDFLRNLPMVEEFLRQGRYKVACLDPMYKMLIGRDENFTGDVADILDQFTQIAERLQICFIYAHHHSKGPQSNRAAIDRGSGAGAWGRDPDVAFDLTEHAQPNCFSASFNLRDFAPINDFVLRWDFPILVEAPELDPKDLKKPTSATGRPQNDNEEVIVLIIKALEVAQGAATIKQIVEAAQIPKRTVHDRLSRKLLPSSRILKTPLGYQVPVPMRKKMKDFRREQFPRDKDAETDGENGED